MTVDSFKYLKLPVALLTAMLTVSLPSYATVVLPTQTVIPGALTSAAGTLLAAEAAPFTAISYSGVLRAAVYLNPNPTEVCPAGNCLDFYYQVQNNGPADSVARETDFVFTGFQTGVSFRTDGASLSSGAAAFVNGIRTPVTADRNGSADAVGFNFNPDANKVLPGESSNVLVIQTNAIRFASGWSSVIDGGATNVPTFQPTTVRISENAPEPASFILFGSGLIAVAFVTRRRVFRNKQ